MVDSLQKLHTEMRACRLCLEAGYEITPPAIFRGQAGAQVMIIGQAPGVTEVEAKRPFNATSGTRLFQWLGEAGWEEEDFRARHYMTAVTKCYPGKSSSGKGDRVPTKAEQALCRPFLEREIALVNPRLIIPVGGLAIKLFFPARARLADVIGTAVYFPSAVTGNPAGLEEWLMVNGKRLMVNGDQLSVISKRSAAHRSPNTDHRSLNTEYHLPNTGRFLIPLPHPSGASLWPNKPANQRLITQATQLLAAVRAAWGL